MSKTAHVTVNLDERANAVLAAIAKRQDLPVDQVVRRAVVNYLVRDEPTLKQTAQPLSRSTEAHAGPQRR